MALKVTSAKESPFPYNVDFSQNDLILGLIKKESTIMADFPMTLEKSQIIEVIARISKGKLLEVKKKMRELYGI